MLFRYRGPDDQGNKNLVDRVEEGLKILKLISPQKKKKKIEHSQEDELQIDLMVFSDTEDLEDQNSPHEPQ